MTAIERQEAFQALIVSLRSDEAPRKPQAVAGLLEAAPLEEYVVTEIECEDCGGTGGDGNALEGWEPCSHCKGSGLEGTPSVAHKLQPATVPALVGAGGAIARRGVASIGPGMFVRTGRRRS